jgi:hypothetical protein
MQKPSSLSNTTVQKIPVLNFNNVICTEYFVSFELSDELTKSFGQKFVLKSEKVIKQFVFFSFGIDDAKRGG